jgi:hypothetical protein
MWSVKTFPKASVSSAGGCLGLAVLVMAMWVKVVSWTWVGEDAQCYADCVPTSWPALPCVASSWNVRCL